MTEYDNSNRGTLGKSKYYEEGTKKPPYYGKGNFKGVEFEMSAWVQENKETGEKFFSIAFQEPYKGGAKNVEVKADDTDMPF